MQTGSTATYQLAGRGLLNRGEGNQQARSARETADCRVDVLGDRYHTQKSP